MPAGTARVVINVENPAKIAYFGHSGGMMIPLEPMTSKIDQKNSIEGLSFKIVNFCPNRFLSFWPILEIFGSCGISCS